MSWAASACASAQATRRSGRPEPGWHGDVLDWIRRLQSERPEEPLTQARLAHWLCDLWHQRPFEGGPVEPPDLMYLIKTLLPRGKSWGGLTCVRAKTMSQQTQIQ